MNHCRFELRVVLLVAFILSLPLGVFAQDGSTAATRRLLLDQANAADTAGHHPEALDLARRAGELEMTPSLRYFIAQQEAALGQVAPALGDADSCVREADRDTAMRNRDSVLEACRGLVTALRSRVGYVVIQIPAPIPTDLHVRVAGVLLDPALYGVQNVVTPGTVQIDATAAGRTPFHLSREVAAHATETVVIQFSGEATTTSTTTSTTSTGTTTSGSPSSDNATHAGSSSTADTGSSGGIGPLRIGGIAVAALGVIGVVVGSVLYAGTSSTFAQCMRVACDPSTEPRGADAAGVVMIWGGGALVIVGAALLVVGTLTAHPASHQVSSRSTGLRFTGAWLDGHSLGITGSF